MAIGTVVDVARHSRGDTWRKSTFQVLANQTNSLSAGHASPLKRFPPTVLSTKSSNLAQELNSRSKRLKSTIYKKVTGKAGLREAGSLREFFHR